MGIKKFLHRIAAGCMALAAAAAAVDAPLCVFSEEEEAVSAEDEQYYAIDLIAFSAAKILSATCLESTLIRVVSRLSESAVVGRSLGSSPAITASLGRPAGVSPAMAAPSGLPLLTVVSS